jgi:DNA-binding beta-propeller fold protein YncE
MTDPPSAECCVAAPDVLEFSPAGDLIGHWGKAEGHDWPSSNHGITVDNEGNVWLGANGGGQVTPKPGAAAAPGRGPAPPARGNAPVTGAEAGVATGGGQYHDSFILKFTSDGKFLGEIGGANKSKGSMDGESVRGVAEIRFNKEGELIAADGYGNKRVSIWDPKTMKIKRFWGAYGTKQIDDANPGAYVPGKEPAKQFRNPVHCAVPSNDGLVYVCDRVNDRLQVFKEDGTFVKEIFMLTNTRGDGSVWEVAFSKDPQQKFMYIADGSNERIHVFERESLKELTAFGDGGRQPGQFYAVHSIATDSKGNIFTTETYRGQRVQKFVYKGLAAVTKKDQGVVWPKKN